MAAYFLHRADGGPMEQIKLMKLMYLADREAIDTYGFPISDDEYWAMRMGPVLSMTLNLMGGYEDRDMQSAWGEWVFARENFRVGLKRAVEPESDLDQLADEEIAVMKDIYDKFGDWPMQNLISYTHGLQEWTDPGRSRLRITFRGILEALGKPEAVIEATLRKLDYLTFIESSPISIPAPVTADAVHA
jgi:uncharacterized phage-associated protein